MAKIIHGDLWVDEDMLTQILELFAHPNMPPFKLDWPEFIDAKRWNILPDPVTGKMYRAEMVFGRTQARGTIKVIRWRWPDRRDPKKKKPHNHPWDRFKSYILRGGYREERWWREGGKPVSEYKNYFAGSHNIVPQHIFHEVTEVFAPDTLTVMICGNGKKGDWGYLDVETGEFSPYVPDPRQQELKRQLNAGK